MEESDARRQAKIQGKMRPGKSISQIGYSVRAKRKAKRSVSFASPFALVEVPSGEANRCEDSGRRREPERRRALISAARIGVTKPLRVRESGRRDALKEEEGNGRALISARSALFGQHGGLRAEAGDFPSPACRVAPQSNRGRSADMDLSKSSGVSRPWHRGLHDVAACCPRRPRLGGVSWLRREGGWNCGRRCVRAGRTNRAAGRAG